MAILSTLRPLPQRLLERLWCLLSGNLPASIEYPMTFTALNDDCLLFILGHISMPQLFLLRRLSRRFSHLIEQYSLPQFKTLIYGYAPKGVKRKRHPSEGQSGLVEAYFTKRHHTYGEFCSRVCLSDHRRNVPTSTLFPMQLTALPESLPHFLPRLSCLTFTYFLADQEEMLTDEQWTVNQLAIEYLDSHWSNTLVSLHLYIQVPAKPMPDDLSDKAFFDKLNQDTTYKHQRTSLKHLYIQFTQYTNCNFLPDAMPILAHLHSFSLHFYGGTNVAMLLATLGPELSFLSFHDVNCHVEDFSAFIRVNPTYRQTLKRLELKLKARTIDGQLFTLLTQCLSSVERLYINPSFEPDADLLTYLTALSHLPKLYDIFYVPLSISQLRALRLRFPLPGTLPRLRSIARAAILIHNSPTEQEDPFQSRELFDTLLPLLAYVFCGLNEYAICFSEKVGQPKIQADETLSEQFSARMRLLLPRTLQCRARYYK